MHSTSSCVNERSSQYLMYLVILSYSQPRNQFFHIEKKPKKYQKYQNKYIYIYIYIYLQYHYNEMVNEFPNLKCVFPEPPILSYHRNHNLHNLLVCSRFTPPSSNRPKSNSSLCLSKRGKGCKFCHSMSNTNFITNIQSGKTCFTSGGRCNTSDTIYAAECTKHKLMYVGHSSQKLSSRFNGHRSDINVKPKS